MRKRASSPLFRRKNAHKLYYIHCVEINHKSPLSISGCRCFPFPYRRRFLSFPPVSSFFSPRAFSCGNVTRADPLSPCALEGGKRQEKAYQRRNGLSLSSRKRQLHRTKPEEEEREREREPLSEIDCSPSPSLLTFSGTEDGERGRKSEERGYFTPL